MFAQQQFNENSCLSNTLRSLRYFRFEYTYIRLAFILLPAILVNYEAFRASEWIVWLHQKKLFSVMGNGHKRDTLKGDMVQ